MISALMVKCSHCHTLDSFTTRSNTPSVDTLANRAGWRKTVKGWLCPSCRLEAPSEEQPELIPQV